MDVTLFELDNSHRSRESVTVGFWPAPGLLLPTETEREGVCVCVCITA